MKASVVISDQIRRFYSVRSFKLNNEENIKADRFFFFRGCPGSLLS